MANSVTRTLDWSDASLAYAIFRLTFGVNICFRGVARIFILGLDNFAAGMMKQFSATPFPAAFISAFAHTLPWIETAIGIMLILGLKTRLVLIIGGLMMTCLTFGTMILQDFTLAWLQLTYAIAFFLLLAARAWNAISLDALLAGSQSGSSAAGRAAQGL
jgi:thiosulfate dehydrogenase [quinone] large subunit